MAQHCQPLSYPGDESLRVLDDSAGQKGWEDRRVSQICVHMKHAHENTHTSCTYMQTHTHTSLSFSRKQNPDRWWIEDTLISLFFWKIGHKKDITSIEKCNRKYIFPYVPLKLSYLPGNVIFRLFSKSKDGSGQKGWVQTSMVSLQFIPITPSFPFTKHSGKNFLPMCFLLDSKYNSNSSFCKDFLNQPPEAKCKVGWKVADYLTIAAWMDQQMP